jgi:hypothetical protein
MLILSTVDCTEGREIPVRAAGQARDPTGAEHQGGLTARFPRYPASVL